MGGMIRVDRAGLDLLMPMNLCIAPSGTVFACGPTLHKLFAVEPVGLPFFDLFTVRRPGGVTGMARLRRHMGDRLTLGLSHAPQTPLRGVATPLGAGQGILLNLSFGIALMEAVRSHALTDADFAVTDLAVELLYMVEAKGAVLEELRHLNRRLHQAKAEAEAQALTDPLTGLRNRRAIDQLVSAAIEAGESFGLMHIDLDFFKEVNDTLGHPAGDHVLREVARILSEETRSDDTVARVGGDEFVVMFPGMTSTDRLAAVAGRMIARLQQPIAFGPDQCRVSASIGMTLSAFYSAATAETLLTDVDRALYAAKRDGRGRAVLAGVIPAAPRG